MWPANQRAPVLVEFMISEVEGTGNEYSPTDYRYNHKPVSSESSAALAARMKREPTFRLWREGPGHFFFF